MSAIYYSETLLPDGAPATDLPDNDWKGIFMSGYNPIVEGPLQRLQNGKAADGFTYAQWTPVDEPGSNDDILKTYYRFLGLFLETYHGEKHVRLTILGGKTYHSNVTTFSEAFPYARYELFRDVIEQLNSAQEQDGTDDWEVNCDLRVEFPGSLLQKLSSGKILPEDLDELTWKAGDAGELENSTEAEIAQKVRKEIADAVEDESQEVEADAVDLMEIDEPGQLQISHSVRRNEARRLTTALTIRSKEKGVDESDTVERTATDNDDGKQIYDDGVDQEASLVAEVDPLSAPQARSPKKRGWTGWVNTDQEIAPPVGSGVARVNIDNIIEGSRSRKRRS
ncbi:hypothetical protein KC340_g2589 [Hortaea werneckii]|nr:hypothetical protein KC342_g2551 [Hortaea werneckii]KAI7104436.1 hypothetical protein KC339_g4546 [Hortaea werneckii]KAI7245193.1 hypothetical protein KC365_g687 [Hortaea werneckii]KAI7334188.1 hypothetical protein KC340_g2589 [Hortaea werneckii]KAI7403870.1 hypothetical protein KC328_g2152 [Hortaea werneckii]